MNQNEVVKLLDYNSFVDKLTQKIANTHSNDTVTSILSIEFQDLSRFNDTFGFHIDEEIITQISGQIESLLNEHDVYTRIGRDQLIIMHNLLYEEEDDSLAKGILHLLSEPCVLKKHMFYIQASIGISLYPFDGRDTSSLIKAAQDTVAYLKKESKELIGFAKEIKFPVVCEETIHLMSDLPAAIENGEIYFLYQAQYSHEKECFVGAELLSRWSHPTYGEISPEVFIPIAEQIGMMGPLSIKAFDAASKAFDFFDQKGIKDFSLSINISPVFLTASNFDETIEFLMQQYDLSDRHLNFEITEEILLKHTNGLLQTLEKLKSYNIRIELDDFGTGYTSLQHLAYLPIDTLKVDRSFVSDLHRDEKKKALFNAIVDMANALSINVIAEGVENSLEDSIIRKFGSIVVQGYLYSKPITLKELSEKLLI